jgi:hypothetical protein
LLLHMPQVHAPLEQSLASLQPAWPSGIFLTLAFANKAEDLAKPFAAP